MMSDTAVNGNRANAIEAVGLAKAFGRKRVVREATFSAPWGAVTGLVGRNGAGKSTLLRLAVGLLRPDAGRVLVGGRPYRDLVEPRRSAGVVLDRAGAHPGLTGRANLTIVADSAGLGRRDVARVLDEAGLSAAADRRVRTYSTGMTQRLALATALLGEPGILILDEPSSGLDVDGIRWLRGLVRARADAGGAVLISTHQLSELATVVDHVVAIEDGCIRANCSVADLRERTRTTSLEDAVLGVLQSST